MRYLDSGSREEEKSLLSWLGGVAREGEIAHMRLQTGYFASSAMGAFSGLVEDLSGPAIQASLLIGSNPPGTPSNDLSDLVTILGLPRIGARAGVVSFKRGLFHTKVYHFTRTDGSQTAYVGSSNLTDQGLRLNIEAGIILESRAGDDESTLEEIAASIDSWFDEKPEGFYPVNSISDVQDLTEKRILSTGNASTTTGELKNRIDDSDDTRPGLTSIATFEPFSRYSPGEEESRELVADTKDAEEHSASRPQNLKEVWRKKNLASRDSQRPGPNTNPSGVLTLVQAYYKHDGTRIDPTRYFRYNVFDHLDWQEEDGKEAATAPFYVKISDNYSGSHELRISHNPDWESGQNNYTTALHWGPLNEMLRNTVDIRGKTLTLYESDTEVWVLEIN